MDDNVVFEEESGLVNLSGVDENMKFETLPRSKYPCTVTALEYRISENGGNPMWAWELEVDSGEHQGAKLFYHTVFKGKPGALARTKRAIGIVAPHLLDSPFNAEAVAGAGELLGTKVVAQTDIRMYQGEKRTNVRDLLPPEEAGEGFLE